MKHKMLGIFLLFFAAWTAPAAADTRFIVRDPAGLTALQQICLTLGCNVSGGLDGGLGKLFLVTAPALIDPNTFLQTLRAQPGITNAELDALLKVMQAAASTAPSGLSDATLVNYFGVSVWQDRKSTRLNSSHLVISYAVFCLKKKNTIRKSF